jgi:hypothetical protein
VRPREFQRRVALRVAKVVWHPKPEPHQFFVPRQIRFDKLKLEFDTDLPSLEFAQRIRDQFFKAHGHTHRERADFIAAKITANPRGHVMHIQADAVAGEGVFRSQSRSWSSLR